MIRLTFVTGAGKQARQKYDDGAAKAVTSTLISLGFSEDRGASCIVECAGSYKMQHDTGKNLKTVVVFPNIVGSEATGGGGGTKQEQQVPKLLDEESPEFMIATSSLPLFTRMLDSKCPSWSQKKGCIAALEELKNLLAGLDDKLVRGTPLDDAEQDFYDTVTSLDDKEALVKKELHQQVEQGNVTQEELDILVEHNLERIAAVKNEKGKTPDKLLQRKDLLASLKPKDPHPLRLEVSIRKLRKELQPLLDMESSSRGRLKSVRETQQMARKEELEEELDELEYRSRGWFEEDDAFDTRVQANRDAFASTVQQKRKKTSGGSYASAAGAGSKKTVNKWVLPGDMKKGAWGKSGPAKKKNKKQGGAVFSAMMMDSDDDDEDDNEPTEGERVTSRVASTKGEPETKNEQANTKSAGGGGGGKNKKKKNKKKGKGQSEDAALDAAVAQQNAAVLKRKEAEATKRELANPAVNFLFDYVVPTLSAILTWFATLILGKPKRKVNKKSN